jgi:hypothetical protein
VEVRIPGIPVGKAMYDDEDIAGDGLSPAVDGKAYSTSSTCLIGGLNPRENRDSHGRKTKFHEYFSNDYDPRLRMERLKSLDGRHRELGMRATRNARYLCLELCLSGGRANPHRIRSGGVGDAHHGAENNGTPRQERSTAEGVSDHLGPPREVIDFARFCQALESSWMLTPPLMSVTTQVPEIDFNQDRHRQAGIRWVWQNHWPLSAAFSNQFENQDAELWG